DIFDRVVSFLATITCLLFSSILGADDAPFRPVMGKRGAAGVAPHDSGRCWTGSPAWARVGLLGALWGAGLGTGEAGDVGSESDSMEVERSATMCGGHRCKRAVFGASHANMAWHGGPGLLRGCGGVSADVAGGRHVRPLCCH